MSTPNEDLTTKLIKSEPSDSSKSTSQIDINEIKVIKSTDPPVKSHEGINFTKAKAGFCACVSAPFVRATQCASSLLASLQSVFMRMFRSSPQKRILMIGLDAAGKTTILYKLKLGEIITTIPTIGFNVESITYKNVTFICWDIGGKDKIRPLWRHYYQDLGALIMVVDSNDLDRVAEVRDELERMLNEAELEKVPLLVFANKQDLPNAMTEGQIADALGLNSIRDRDWSIQRCCAVKGDGLYEGFDWVSRTITPTK